MLCHADANGQLVESLVCCGFLCAGVLGRNCCAAPTLLIVD